MNGTKPILNSKILKDLVGKEPVFSVPQSNLVLPKTLFNERDKANSFNEERLKVGSLALPNPLLNERDKA